MEYRITIMGNFHLFNFFFCSSNSDFDGVKIGEVIEARLPQKHMVIKKLEVGVFVWCVSFLCYIAVFQRHCMYLQQRLH